jgi:hypothetical protein
VYRRGVDASLASLGDERRAMHDKIEEHKSAVFRSL